MQTCRACDVDHRRGSSECPAQRIGSTVADKYELIDLLGVGGMGAVYRARHRTLGTMVALKMIHARLAANEQIIARFDAEARRAASLEHPGIVNVTDLGRDLDGSPYLEMELLDGDSVVDLVRRGELSTERALEVIIETLDALAFAHSKGVIHRDLKPENLFIANTGDGTRRVKILDFGIAKALQESGDQGMTRTGSVMGTPTYMSPEQLKDSKNVDERADIYSMGASLYEMLTGTNIVVATTVTELMSKILVGEIERHPRGFLGTIPAWLDAIVAKSLAMKPEDRYASAAAMRDAIKAHAVVGTAQDDASPAHVAAPEPARQAPALTEAGDVAPAHAAPSVYQPTRSKLPWILAGVGAIGVAAVVVVVGFGGDDAPSVTDSTSRDAAVPDEPVRPDAEVARRESPEPPDGMVYLAAGPFQMGSSEEEIAAAMTLCRRDAGKDCSRELYDREQPRRTVTVSPFFIDAREVTNRGFAAWLASQSDVSVMEGRDIIAGDGVSLYDLHPDFAGIAYRGTAFEAVPERASLPVVQVTWAGADRYCKSMGKSLPSEAQWERAAAGSDGRAFPWGEDSEPSCEGVAYGRRKGLRCETSGDAPRDVGTSSVDATAEGVYDLGGNVAEWTADDFADRYDGGCAPPCRDPVVRNDSGLKVARGGYFDGRAEALRSAGRSRFQVVSAQINVGFRCVKSAPSEEKP